MTHIISRYNVLSTAISGEIAVFNTLTQNVAIFGVDEYTSLASAPVNSQAVQHGFVVPVELDERALAQDFGRQLRYQHKDGLALTVVPSAACNFSCGYCYNGIDHEKGKTHLAGQNALIYAQTHLHRGESLHVTWYGGEPSMFMREISHWSNAFKTLCKDFGSAYSSDLLTNGSLLTRDVVNALVEASVAHIQISIDWPLSTSQRKWGARDARQSLEEVLKNAIHVAPEVPTTIRVNAMPEFLETFDELLELLLPLRGLAGVYLHRVHESNVDALNTPHSTAFRYEHISTFYADYATARRKLRAFGFKQPFFPETFESSVCIAQTDRDLIFTPDGLAKKCVKEISGTGAELQLNRTPLPGSEHRIAFYRHGEVANNSECGNCAFLPICHGGCVKDLYEEPDNIEGRCTPWKYTLSSELTEYLKGRV